MPSKLYWAQLWVFFSSDCELSAPLDRSYGVEYSSGVESIFGVATILIKPADSVYFLISGLFFFELT